jgi:hypothetical protein
MRKMGEAVPTGEAGSGSAARSYGESADRPGSHIGRGVPWAPSVAPMLGWEPSCVCAAETAPCVVLDPFGGAGTTALVARRTGRRFVHIELNPAYMEIARRRVEGEAFQPSLFAGGAA